MRILVDTDKVKIVNKPTLCKGEYGVHKCEFEFSDEYSDLTKVAIFKYDYSVYKVDIVNNVCNIPSEVLETTGTFKMGVYAYATNGEELVIRYSPAMEELTVTNGSYSKEGKTPAIIEPTQYELYGEALMVGLTELDTGLEKLNNEVDKLITDKENGVFNGKDGVNGKDGKTPVKGVDYFDGVNGKDGKDGYTPVKNVDYFDGKDGVNGTNGKDGVTPTLKVGSTTTGNAIRSKNGTTDTYKPSEMANAIENIETGGSGGEIYTPSYIRFNSYTGYSLVTQPINTSLITNMAQIFYSCKQVKTLDLTGWDTSNVTTMASMFDNCSALTNIIGLSKFNLSKVTTTANMLQYAKIETIELTGSDVPKLTDCSYMFSGCSKATNIDLSTWTTPNLTKTDAMFSRCSVLANLDMRNADFSKVTSYSSMFNNVPVGCLIIVKDDTQKEWITSKFTTLTNVKTVAELEG